MRIGFVRLVALLLECGKFFLKGNDCGLLQIFLLAFAFYRFVRNNRTYLLCLLDDSLERTLEQKHLHELLIRLLASIYCGPKLDCILIIRFIPSVALIFIENIGVRSLNPLREVAVDGKLKSQRTIVDLKAVDVIQAVCLLLGESFGDRTVPKLARCLN